jgi:hypothetical protein
MVWPKIVLLSAFLFFFKEKGNMSKTIVIQSICSVHKISQNMHKTIVKLYYNLSFEFDYRVLSER